MCYTVGPYLLSILNIAVCNCASLAIPSPHPPPLVTISLFPKFVNLFLFCKLWTILSVGLHWGVSEPIFTCITPGGLSRRVDPSFLWSHITTTGVLEQFTLAHHSQLLYFQNSVNQIFKPFIAWNQPWWEYLGHKHQNWLLNIYQHTADPRPLAAVLRCM